jgi:biotin carboxylase
MSIAVLVGASPFGSSALVACGVPFVLVVPPDEDPGRAKGEPLAVLECDFERDPSAILRLRELYRREIAAAFSFTELGLLPAALLAEAVGAPTVSVATTLRTRHKLLMRRALEGVAAQPRYGILTERAVAMVPLPAVLKPFDEAGSRGIRFAERREDCLEALEEAEGALMYEEYLEGPEVSVETVSFEGRHEILGVTEKRTTGPPHFVENGQVSVSSGPRRHERACAATAAVLDRLGVATGAAHTELRLMRGEPYPIETHTRPGGDRIPRITELVTGSDQYELAVRSTLGLGRPERREPRFPAAGIKYFEWSRGVLEAVDVSRAKDVPGVVEVSVDAAPGAEVGPALDNTERPGFVVVGGPDPEEVERRLAAAVGAVTVTYATPVATAS